MIRKMINMTIYPHILYSIPLNLLHLQKKSNTLNYLYHLSLCFCLFFSLLWKKITDTTPKIKAIKNVVNLALIISSNGVLIQINVPMSPDNIVAMTPIPE